MTTAAVLAAIARERARLDAALAAIGDRASTAPVSADGWTAKDVLAHLIHYAGQVAFGLGAKLAPPAYLAGVTGRPTGEEWNAIVVAHYREASLAAVKADLDRAMDALVERTALRTDAEMQATDAIPWAAGRPLWQIIGGETFLHWPAHCADIERAVARLA